MAAECDEPNYKGDLKPEPFRVINIGETVEIHEYRTGELGMNAIHRSKGLKEVQLFWQNPNKLFLEIDNRHSHSIVVKRYTMEDVLYDNAILSLSQYPEFYLNIQTTPEHLIITPMQYSRRYRQIREIPSQASGNSRIVKPGSKNSDVTLEIPRTLTVEELAERLKMPFYHGEKPLYSISDRGELNQNGTAPVYSLFVERLR